jgi:hypothetical protein
LTVLADSVTVFAVVGIVDGRVGGSPVSDLPATGSLGADMTPAWVPYATTLTMYSPGGTLAMVQVVADAEVSGQLSCERPAVVATKPAVRRRRRLPSS